jgi:nucleoside-triphosphatase THEP1
MQKLIDEISTILSPRIAKSVTYVEQGKRFCAAGTQTTFLAKIEELIDDISNDGTKLIWLTGDPGVGKSTITASVAGKYKDKKLLLVQFFISRSHASTRDPNSIFPTIAYQLAKQHPKAARTIRNSLEQQSSLSDYITDIQALKLFVEPMKVLSDLDPSKPIVIVIDAFDELDGDIRGTTEILAKAIMMLPKNVKVFVSSRQEHGIRTCISRMMRHNRATQINLDISDPSLIADVAMYLRNQIARVVSDNLDDMEEWPGEDVMQALCARASGLFIWAVTVIEFIQANIVASGSEGLKEVLDDINSKGMGSINTLYHAILTRLCPDGDDGWVFERFRRIVGSIIALEEPQALATFTGLLDLRKTNTSDPVDIKHFFRRFRTVLVPGTDDINDTTIPRLHRSFIEFITTNCDYCFRVNTVASHAELAVRCLHQLHDLRRDMCDIECLAMFNINIPDLPSKIDECLSAQLRYACRFWSIHLLRGKSMTDIAAQQFHDFFHEHLLHWIETMSLLDYNSVFSLLGKAAEWAHVRFLLYASLKNMVT